MTTTAMHRRQLLALAEAEQFADQIADLRADLRRAPKRTRGPLRLQLAEATSAWVVARATLNGDTDV